MKSATLTALAPVWLWSYAGVVLLMGVLVNLASGFAQMTHSLTIPPMQESLSLNYTQVGVLLTGASVVRMASTLGFGTLAARYGSRTIVGLGVVGTGGAMLFLGASPNFLVALLAMAVLGFVSGAALTPMMGLLSAWFDLRNRGVVAGLAAAGGSVAFVAAGVLVPRLVDARPDDGWRYTWYLFGVVIVGVGVICLLFLRDQPRVAGSAAVAGPSRAPRAPWPLAVYKNPLVWLSAGMAFCSGWSHGIFSTFFGAYLSQEGVGLSVAGQLLIVIGILTIPSSVLWGRLSDRMGRGRAFHYSFLLQSVSFGLFWIWPVTASFIAASVLLGLTLRATYTICAASSADYVPVRFSPAAFALMSVGAGFGTSISPVIGGAVADAAGSLGWAFALALLSTVIGTVGGLALHRTATRAIQSPPSYGQ